MKMFECLVASLLVFLVSFIFKFEGDFIASKSLFKHYFFVPVFSFLLLTPISLYVKNDGSSYTLGISILTFFFCLFKVLKY